MPLWPLFELYHSQNLEVSNKTELIQIDILLAVEKLKITRAGNITACFHLSLCKGVDTGTLIILKG
jgi:hypothetical protein